MLLALSNLFPLCLVVCVSSCASNCFPTIVSSTALQKLPGSLGASRRPFVRPVKGSVGSLVVVGQVAKCFQVKYAEM